MTQVLKMKNQATNVAEMNGVFISIPQFTRVFQLPIFEF